MHPEFSGQVCFGEMGSRKEFDNQNATPLNLAVLIPQRL